MSYEKDVYSLAKALHHINMAMIYFEDVKRDCKGSIKDTFTGYISRCKFILDDNFHKLNDYNRSIFKEELSDSLGLDHINNQLMSLNNAERLQVEKIINEMVKGKKIKITFEDDESPKN